MSDVWSKNYNTTLTWLSIIWDHYIIVGGNERDIKGDEVSTLTWTGKMMIPVDCDKLRMHNKIPRAATRKAVQRDTLKTLSITQNRILINVLKTTGRQEQWNREK